MTENNLVRTYEPCAKCKGLGCLSNGTFRTHTNFTGITCDLCNGTGVVEFKPITTADLWQNVKESTPSVPRKYLVYRAGKIHFEMWNGTGWAYNNDTITHWQEILPPKI